jgi:hypothetical protein
MSTEEESIVSEEQFNYILLKVVDIFKRDVMSSAEIRLTENVYAVLLERLKSDVTKIILAARNVKIDDFMATMAPSTSVYDLPEWKENKRIKQFLTETKMRKLEDVYILGISDEIARKCLCFDESNDDYLIFVNALKLRGYSLRKDHNPL